LHKFSDNIPIADPLSFTPVFQCKGNHGIGTAASCHHISSHQPHNIIYFRDGPGNTGQFIDNGSGSFHGGCRRKAYIDKHRPHVFFRNKSLGGGFHKGIQDAAKEQNSNNDHPFSRRKEGYRSDVGIGNGFESGVKYPVKLSEKTFILVFLFFCF